MRLLVPGREVVDVTDSSQLARALDAVEANGGPVLVHLSGASGDLGVGLHDPESTVVLFRTRTDPPTALHATGGAAHRTSGRPLVFRAANGPATFFDRIALPAETALPALRHFLETGERPGWLTWEPEGTAPGS